MELPPVSLVRQTQPQPSVADVAGETRRLWRESPVARRVRRGMRVASGVVKMLAIGLGKQRGAAQHHRWGLRGLTEMVPSSARAIVANTKFAGALAVVENAREETAKLAVIDRDELFDAEPRLLEDARG